MTGPEKSLWKMLEDSGFTIKPFSKRTIIDPLNCIYSQMNFKTMRLDFALPAAKIAIEVDGDYWHGSRQKSVTATQLKRQMGDVIKKTELANAGWGILTIVASDMKRNKFAEKLKERIWSLMSV